MIDYIHIFISLIAAVAYAIVGLATAQDLFAMLPRLIIIISVFYIAGLILRTYLRRTVFKEEDIDLSAEVEAALEAEMAAEAEVGEGAPPDDEYEDLL